MASSQRFGRSESLVLNSRTFAEFASAEHVDGMTVHGAVTKTVILLVIVVASAAWSCFSTPHNAGLDGFSGWLGLAMVAAFVVGMITAFTKNAAPITAPVYAALEGTVLGGVSAVFENYFPGVVFPAIVLTFGTLFGLLVLYGIEGVQVTGAFRRGVISATVAIALMYLVGIGLRLAGVVSIPLPHEGGVYGVLFSLFVVFIAALNLVLDFDLVEAGARDGAPKYMEWYAAYSLMVTLIWLYLEVLKLMIQIAAASRDD